MFSIGAIDLAKAVASDKPVILWHTSTGSEYIGYELLATDTFGSNIAMGVPGMHYDPERKIHSISEFFFIEYDGFIVSAPSVWPMNGLYWLGNDVIDRYLVHVQLTKKKVPKCAE
jgi:hypothetical protein